MPALTLGILVLEVRVILALVVQQHRVYRPDTEVGAALLGLQKRPMVVCLLLQEA